MTEESDDFDAYGLDPEIHDITVYEPPGPISAAFLASTELSSFIMGPVGSGKTTTAAFKRIQDGAGQGICKDGWIRDRCLILRKTWRTAKRTVLRSWADWFQKGYPGSTWTGGEDRPATHVLRFHDPNRRYAERDVKIELETEFAGLDDNNIDVLLGGAPYSRILLNEADQFSKDIVERCEERVGRYPNLVSLADGQRRTRQVTGDFNAPDKTNYLRELLVEDVKPNRHLIALPAGLIVDWNADGTIGKFEINREAENLSKLDADYYTSKALTWEEWRLRRYVLNEWGYSREGLPVFVKEFREGLHVSPRILDHSPTVGLTIGVDGSTAGLRPAAVIMQPDSGGYLNVLKTLAPGHGYGALRFAHLLLDLLQSEYRRVPYVDIWCDPASQYGGDKEGGQLAFIETLSMVLGIAVRVPAGGSNEIGLRLDAIRKELTTVIEGEQRRLRISADPSNKILINGFASGYCFQKRPPNAPTQWEPVPRKNEFSDPMDALGYGVLGLRRIMPHTLAGQDGFGGNVRQGWSGRGAGRPAPWQRAGTGRDFDVNKV